MISAGTFLKYLAQAFAANCICKIPCISTRWVLSTVHEARARTRAAGWESWTLPPNYDCLMMLTYAGVGSNLSVPNFATRSSVETLMQRSLTRVAGSEDRYNWNADVRLKIPGPLNVIYDQVWYLLVSFEALSLGWKFQLLEVEQAWFLSPSFGSWA